MLKTCPACQKEFPATRDYFYWRKKAIGQLTQWCIPCYKAHLKHRYPKPKPKPKPKPAPLIPAPLAVIPAKAGIHKTAKALDSGLKPAGMTARGAGMRAVQQFLNNEIPTTALMERLKPIYGRKTQQIINEVRAQMGLPAVKRLICKITPS